MISVMHRPIRHSRRLVKEHSLKDLTAQYIYIYIGILWDEGSHKTNVRSFLGEISEILIGERFSVFTLATDDQVSRIFCVTPRFPSVRGGIDIRRVQMWLGHQTLQMTMRYARLATNDLNSCVAVLERG